MGFEKNGEYHKSGAHFGIFLLFFFWFFLNIKTKKGDGERG